VVVTGGASGIGRAIAEAFVRLGGAVAIVGRNEQRLREAALAFGSSVICQTADVSRLDQVSAAVQAIVRQFGQVDVLVNNAGIARHVSSRTPLPEAEALWDEVLATNLKGSFLTTLCVAPHLTRPGGRVINISSITAYSGGHGPGSMAYATSKAGLNGLTYALARELGPEGVTVNAVAPGFIDTEFNRTLPQDYVEAVLAETPVGRVGNVEDVVAAVLYLASPNASFVTGEVLSVNGGRLFGR
jgi:3-oxoacyl-[acyl-carrier protein] reductase